MIVLERLQAHNFKQLRDVDLAFPRQCRVLIEGLNEAGKSTLFEVIHFVLYGRGLVTLGRGRGATDSVISYGEQAAYVAADLRLSGTSVRVERLLTRNRPAQATCVVEQADGTREEIRQTQRVNEELLAHLSGLDSDSLLASCFVEQKKLAKLEELTRDRRQEVLLKLLDLDRLTRVRRQFVWDRRDEHALTTSERRLRLAETTQRLAILRSELVVVERRVALASIHSNVAEADDAAVRAAELATELAELIRAVANVSAQITAIEALEHAILLLERARASLLAAADDESRVAELDAELASLDRLEAVIMPALRSEGALLERIIEQLIRVAALDAEIAKARERTGRLSGVIAAGNALDRLASELARARAVVDNEAATCAVAQRLEAAAERVATLHQHAESDERERARCADRAARIREATRAWREACDRSEALDVRTRDLAAADEAARVASARADAARRLDACRVEARELEHQMREARAREARLSELERARESLERLSATAEPASSPRA